MLEYWMRKAAPTAPFPIDPAVAQYPITPLLHYSTTPLPQRSNTPLPQHSNTPLLQHPNTPGTGGGGTSPSRLAQVRLLEPQNDTQ